LARVRAVNLGAVLSLDVVEDLLTKRDKLRQQNIELLRQRLTLFQGKREFQAGVEHLQETLRRLERRSEHALEVSSRNLI
jgi:hypothetical protein